MKFEDALKLMREGKKVRLPTWEGDEYCEMKYSNTGGKRIFTESGELLIVEWGCGQFMREDWEEYVEDEEENASNENNTSSAFQQIAEIAIRLHDYLLELRLASPSRRAIIENSATMVYELLEIYSICEKYKGENK